MLPKIPEDNQLALADLELVVELAGKVMEALELEVELERGALQGYGSGSMT
jgi:hypothetical protein